MFPLLANPPCSNIPFFFFFYFQLVRFIFLESIAGVPGMVAGTLRHLHSLRRLRPDNGWIKTLLEESYNERMHLLTFIQLASSSASTAKSSSTAPATTASSLFMRTAILCAQGIFYNTMFVAYLISPRVCHRFVGYLEEEAVHTYTRCLRELDAGLLPRWTDPGFTVPEMAVRYWAMPEGRRGMRDLILYIRVSLIFYSHRLRFFFSFLSFFLLLFISTPFFFFFFLFLLSLPSPPSFLLFFPFVLPFLLSFLFWH
jgi:hypothetical protein